MQSLIFGAFKNNHLNHKCGPSISIKMKLLTTQEEPVMLCLSPNLANTVNCTSTENVSNTLKDSKVQMAEAGKVESEQVS